MTIKNAITFLEDIDFEPKLRSRVYACKSRGEWLETLQAHGTPFTPSELEESINMLHVQCQTYEQADDLLHKADCIRMIIADFYPNQVPQGHA